MKKAHFLRNQREWEDGLTVKMGWMKEMVSSAVNDFHKPSQAISMNLRREKMINNKAGP